MRALKKLLGILVLGLLLSSCDPPGYNTPSTVYTPGSTVHKCITHSETGQEFCGFGVTYTAAKKSALAKCRAYFYTKNPDACDDEQLAKKTEWTKYAKHVNGTKIYESITSKYDLAQGEAISFCKQQDPNAKEYPEGCVWYDPKTGNQGIPTDTKPKKKEPKQTPDDDELIIIGSGSGFFISEQGHIVSNDHVVGVCKKVKTYEAGKEIYLDILATDNVNDIGLVKGKFKNTKYLNIKTDGAELGEDIIAFGYPLSQTLSDSVKLTKGIVSSLTGLGNNISQIQIDAAIQPGNSGGPVVNMNAQVVGIASAGLSKLYMAQEANYIPENVNFAVASQTLTAFLKAHKINIGTDASRTLNPKELAKIGEPVTIQLFCMNTMAEYAKLKKADKHSDMLLDLQ